MNKKFEYSKLIIIFETILIGFLTFKVLNLVELSINNLFDGSFPYLTTMVSVAWAAYGTSVSFYYSKAKLENQIKLSKQGVDLKLIKELAEEKCEKCINFIPKDTVDYENNLDDSTNDYDNGALG